MNYRKITIGRDSSCDLIIDHDSISRKHAELFIDEDTNVFITDLHSKNGTYVNNSRIYDSRQIVFGDKILIGNKIEVDWLQYAPQLITYSQPKEEQHLPQPKKLKLAPYFITITCVILAIIYINSNDEISKPTITTDANNPIISDEDKPLDKREDNIHLEDKKNDERGKSTKSHKKSKIDASCIREENDLGTTNIILIGEELEKQVLNSISDEVTLEDEKEQGELFLQDQKKNLTFIESGKKIQNLKSILKLLVKEIENPRGFNYQIHLIKSDEWNAYTVGGQIFVTTTIYDFTETSDELACIIAHEIFHNELFHINENIKRNKLPGASIYSLITQSFGQKKETYCDLNGIDLAVNAGFQGCSAAELWYRMKKEESNSNRSLIDKFFRSHPYSDQRQQCAERHMDINYNTKCNLK